MCAVKTPYCVACSTETITSAACASTIEEVPFLHRVVLGLSTTTAVTATPISRPAARRTCADGSFTSLILRASVETQRLQAVAE